MAKRGVTVLLGIALIVLVITYFLLDKVAFSVVGYKCRKKGGKEKKDWF